MTQQLPNLEGAACATSLGRILFSEETDEYVDTCRAICASCPVQRKCLLWGVQHEHHGMWGGLSAEELKSIRRRNQIRCQEPPAISMRVLLQQQTVAAKQAGATA